MNIPLSSQTMNCEGYGNYGASGNGYLLGFVLGTGKTKVFSSKLNSKLLEVVAFDAAEVEDTTIGQINMITVSSFCGPLGLIWGYDLAIHENLREPHEFGPRQVKDKEHVVNVHSLKPLLAATKALFGTAANKRFSLLAGSHVPCAAKYINSDKPGYLYCSVSIGIPNNRIQDACLLMEDVGSMEKDDIATKESLLEESVQSIMRVGDNQGVSYKEIFTDIKVIKIDKGEVGCALVAMPYFTLAKNAVSDFPGDKLYHTSLREWEVRCFNEN